MFFLQLSICLKKINSNAILRGIYMKFNVVDRPYIYFLLFLFKLKYYFSVKSKVDCSSRN